MTPFITLMTISIYMFIGMLWEHPTFGFGLGIEYNQHILDFKKLRKSRICDLIDWHGHNNNNNNKYLE